MGTTTSTPASATGGLVNVAQLISSLAPLFLGSGATTTTQGAQATTSGSTTRSSIDPATLSMLTSIISTAGSNASNPTATKGIVDNILKESSQAFAPVIAGQNSSGIYGSSTLANLASESKARATAAASKAVLDYTTSQQNIQLNALSTVASGNKTSTTSGFANAAPTSSIRLTAPSISPLSGIATIGGGVLANKLLGSKAVEGVTDAIGGAITDNILQPLGSALGIPGYSAAAYTGPITAEQFLNAPIGGTSGGAFFGAGGSAAGGAEIGALSGSAGGDIIGSGALIGASDTIAGELGVAGAAGAGALAGEAGGAGLGALAGVDFLAGGTEVGAGLAGAAIGGEAAAGLGGAALGAEAGGGLAAGLEGLGAIGAESLGFDFGAFILEALPFLAWIICTELLRQGKMSVTLYRYGAKKFKSYPAYIKFGYLLWARPVRDYVRANPNTKLTWFIAKVFDLRVHNIAYHMGCSRAKWTIRGAIICSSLYVICTVLGLLLIPIQGNLLKNYFVVARTGV